ncbi:DegV family protein [Oceanirhabdus sp. W0125-5]|uniref:DegV family protein n=1 Tax=Oceanirhabdus sp. W0125-5 TaxID=2999116 RepID=UPI0022F34952|nr:DegV family protein [Oceanirhabdus sp. W0125-5]WBW99669.1 DegV family protein [Oceanirhabdus sp. W0125-5]
MEKIALITDSTADLTEETIKKYNITVLPFRIIYKDREYLDGVDIKANEVYENLQKEVPTSSLPPLKKMHDVYISLQEQGFTHVIAILLSSGLSGIYNALSLVSKEYPKIQSFIFDSKSISCGEGLLVEESAKLITSQTPFDTIKEKIEEFRKKLEVYFVVDTLEYLKRGGRIGRVSGTIGELLKIKPIISVGEDGKYFTVDKIRGKKQSLKKIIEIGKSKLKENTKIVLMDGYAKKEVQYVYDELKKYSEEFQQGFVELIGSISPVSGVHSGPGLVGMVVFNK